MPRNSGGRGQTPFRSGVENRQPESLPGIDFKVLERGGNGREQNWKKGNRQGPERPKAPE